MKTATTSDHEVFSSEVIAHTKLWLERAVIGLNLCPFVKAVFIKNQIRYVVSSAETAEELLADLVRELNYLQEADPEKTDTTLLIHPDALRDFLDYNDFLDVADAAIEELDLEGELQVASFHPDYQFADAAIGDIGNYTNRSPYPTLHLLRESSVERAVDAFPEASDIFNKNMQTLNRLGLDGWKRVLQQSED
ncbi:DUF1415 domain-containing protein [Collimonas sp.]|uniref:DUF1415 domain-containing protein n=1 Tax=Collimonas sp. TaxID=1963772 RepID=UPI0037C0D07C